MARDIGGKGFIVKLDDISRKLDKLADSEASRIVEWTFNSVSWKILKEIKRSGVWPVMTGTSRKKWGFKRVKVSPNKVTFEIFNDATVNEQRSARGVNPLKAKGELIYAGWVYAKGDSSKRNPIAPGIVKRATISAKSTLKQNYYQRLNKYLLKKV